MKPQIASSGSSVLPTTIAPASRSRRTDLGVGGRRVGEAVGAVGGHVAGDVDVVLDRDRHAEQRPLLAPSQPRLGLLGLEQRFLGEHRAEGVELRVDPLDPLQAEAHQLGRGDLPRPHHLRLLRRSREGEVVSHGAGAIFQVSSGSGSAGAPPSKLRSGSSRSSQDGIHQFQSPSSFIAAGHEDQPHQRRVERDRHRAAQAQLLDRGHAGEDEDGEDRGHDQRRRGDRAGAGGEALGDGALVVAVRHVALADAGHAGRPRSPSRGRRRSRRSAAR